MKTAVATAAQVLSTTSHPPPEDERTLSYSFTRLDYCLNASSAKRRRRRRKSHYRYLCRGREFFSESNKTTHIGGNVQTACR